MATPTLVHSMTKTERADLRRIARLNMEAAKAEAVERAKRVLADGEAALAARYPINHEAWAHVTEKSKKLVGEMDAEIARICREMNIQESFRPSLNIVWSSRGENGIKERREELRRVLKTEVEARLSTAIGHIKRVGNQQLVKIETTGLESAEAKAFLESMPSVEALLPPISDDDFKGLEADAKGYRRLLLRPWADD